MNPWAPPPVQNNAASFSGPLNNSGTGIFGNTSVHGNQTINFGGGSDSKTKCIRALFVTDPSEDRGKYIAFHDASGSGRCAKLLKRQEYKAWEELESHSQLLWLTGGPGTGKTVLSLFLTKELESTVVLDKRSVLCYYFCDGSDIRRNTAINVLRGLVYTLLKEKPQLEKHIVPEFEVRDTHLFDEDAIEAMWRIFQAMVLDPDTGPVYCVVDGLDQCFKDQPTHLQHLISKIQTFFTNSAPRADQTLSAPDDEKPPPMLKMIILGRDQPAHLFERLQKFPRVHLGRDAKRSLLMKQRPMLGYATLNTSQFNFTHNVSTITRVADSPVIPNETQQLDADDETDSLSAHLRIKLTHISSDKGLSDQQQQQLIGIFDGKGDTNYLWVDVVTVVLAQTPALEVLATANQIPDHLEDLYSFALERLPSELASTAAIILRVVAVGINPLYHTDVAILCHFVSKNNIKDDGTSIGDRLEDTLPFLQPFVTINLEGEYSIANETSKDFLIRHASPLNGHSSLGHFWIDVNQAQSELAAACIAYLEDSGRDDGAALHAGPVHLVSGEEQLLRGKDQWERSDATITQYPLLPYAIRNWPNHLREAFPFEVNMDSSFFQHKSKLRRNWWESYWSDCTGRGVFMCPSTSSLHTAAFLNLLTYVKQLAKAPDFVKKIDKTDGELQTALAVAVSRGSPDVCGYLLENGAKPFAFDYPILHLACSQGQLNVVQTLVDCFEALVLDISSETKSPKSQALKTLPQKSVLKHRLEIFGKWDVGDSTTGLEGALIVAITEGHEPVVRYLLDKGADIKHKSSTNWTMMHFAALSGSVSIMEHLIERGADPHTEAPGRVKPIHVAAQEGWTSAVAFLVEEHGASMEEANEDRRTPLHLAASCGQHATLQYLLDRGAFIDARDVKDRTALQLAIRGTTPNSAACVVSLLKAKANPNQTDAKGRTPLHDAAIIGNIDTIIQLLDFGADQTLLTKKKESPVQLAKGGKKGAAAQVLLNHAASTGANEPRSFSVSDPLHRADTFSSTASDTVPDLNVVDADSDDEIEQSISRGGSPPDQMEPFPALADSGQMSPPLSAEMLTPDLTARSPPLEAGSPYFGRDSRASSVSASPNLRKTAVAPWSQSVNSFTRSVRLSTSQINLGALASFGEQLNQPGEETTSKASRPLSSIFQRSASVTSSPALLIEDSQMRSLSDPLDVNGDLPANTEKQLIASDTTQSKASPFLQSLQNTASNSFIGRKFHKRAASTASPELAAMAEPQETHPSLKGIAEPTQNPATDSGMSSTLAETLMPSSSQSHGPSLLPAAEIQASNELASPEHNGDATSNALPETSKATTSDTPDIVATLPLDTNNPLGISNLDFSAAVVDEPEPNINSTTNTLSDPPISPPPTQSSETTDRSLPAVETENDQDEAKESKGVFGKLTTSLPGRGLFKRKK